MIPGAIASDHLGTNDRLRGRRFTIIAIGLSLTPQCGELGQKYAAANIIFQQDYFRGRKDPSRSDVSAPDKVGRI